MPYFSRLTDIVTCSLSALLEKAADPQAALEEIILEMKQGVAGAQRSVKTARANVARLESEIGEQRAEVASWVAQAKQLLQQGDDGGARQALMRKQEVEDLIAGVEQQLQAAVLTRDHLTTTLLALEARLADAQRRQSELAEPHARTDAAAKRATQTGPAAPDRVNRLEAELEDLRRELGQA